MLCWDGSRRPDAAGADTSMARALPAGERWQRKSVGQAGGRLSLVPRIARDVGSVIALAITYEAR